MASEKIEAYSEYRLRVKACHECKVLAADKVTITEDTVHTSKIKSVPAYYHADKCEVLFVGLEPDLKDFTKPQAIPFSGETGRLLADMLDHLELTGDSRIGYTTLIKCKLMSGTVRRRCAKRCMARHLAWELQTLHPRLLILMGKNVASLLIPDLITSIKNTKYSSILGYEGEIITLLDQAYLLVPDPSDSMSVEKYDQYKNKADHLWFESCLKPLREMLP